MNLLVDEINDNGHELKVLALQSYYQVYKYDYIKDSSLRSRPLWANQHYVCKNIIWLNNDLGEIGFIGASACRVLKLADIERLEVTNILPARGPGSTELVAIFKSNNDRKEIYFERGAYFDYRELEMIRLFSNLSILIFADSYDC